MALPAGLRLSPVDHFDMFVLFFGNKGNGVAFRAIKAHGLNMRIMAESDFTHSLDRKLDISPPDSSQRCPGKQEDRSQQ
jgi:hypothetical protein